MLETKQFGKALSQLGFNAFSGVPCSYLSPLFNHTINQDSFIMANNEGDAVAIASGISLVGMHKDTFGVVLMQNSGLSNALSPLTSLNDTFHIPILGFVSLRGERDEAGNNTDEPQHELLGIITDKLLQTCNISYAFLSGDYEEALSQLHQAKEILKQGKSFFFIVRKKTFSKVELDTAHLPHSTSHTPHTLLHQISNHQKPTRLQALEILHATAKHTTALLATTGKTGRELYEIEDTPNQLYMVGSMGCVGSLALGISLQSLKKVIAIDGDSALLMRLGALSTNAYYAKQRNLANFCHVCLDNQSHDSTGGQFNLSPHVHFAHIAMSCGYDQVYIASNLLEFQHALQSFMSASTGGAYFIYLRIAKGSKENLGRPKITPKEVAQRFCHWINAC